MTRIPNSNYTSSPFIRATDDNDRFDRDDLNLLAAALDLHDHSDTRGLPVARIANSAVTESALANGAVVDTKIGNRTINPALVPSSNGPDTLTNLLSQLANRIKDAKGTTNWYDATPVPLSLKVSKAGDGMLGQLAITKAGALAAASGWANAHILLQTPAPGDPGFPGITFHNPGVVATLLFGAKEAVNGGSPLKVWDGVTLGKLMTDKNGGAGSTFNADMLDGLHAGQANGQIPISNSLINDQLFAMYTLYMTVPGVGHYAAGNAAHHIPISNGVLNAGLNADQLDGQEAAAFAAAGHSHGSFVPASGGTFTGGVSFTGGFNVSSGIATLSGGVNLGAGITANGHTILGLGGVQITSGQFSAEGFDGSAGAPLYRMRNGGAGLFTSGANEVGFATQSQGRGRIQDSGNLVWLHNITCVALTETSDRELKDGIVYMESRVTDRMRKLQPVNFFFKDEKVIRAGFIAQDVQQHFPDIVRSIPGMKDSPRKKAALGVDNMGLIANLWKYAQEIDERLQKVEAA